MYIYFKLRRRHIVRAGNETISTRQNRDELINNAPLGRFAFSRESYIINLDMAASARNSEITFMDDTTLLLSTHYEDAFVKALLVNAVGWKVV